MTDLPLGYRWATELETEAINAGRPLAHLVVARTADSTGTPYTHDEADIAVPIDLCDYAPQCPNPGYAHIDVLGHADAGVVCESHLDDATASDHLRWWEPIDHAQIESTA